MVLAKQTPSAAASVSKRRDLRLWAFAYDFSLGRRGEFFERAEFCNANTRIAGATLKQSSGTLPTGKPASKEKQPMRFSSGTSCWLEKASASASALPGGNGNSDGSFNNVGKNGNWWSATENDASNAWNRNMNYNNAKVNRNNNDKTNLFSVRCVQDCLGSREIGFPSFCNFAPMQRKKQIASPSWKTLTLLALLILNLTSCGPTRIPVEVDKPSTLNTTGIKRIAVMPFETDNHAYKSLASYATSITTEKIRETGRFTLVDGSEILRLRRRKQNIESYVDAMFVGRIMRVGIDKDSKTSQSKDKNGNISYSTSYFTKVEVEFNYSLKMAKDGRLIGPVSRKGIASAYSNDGYPSIDSLLIMALTPQIALIRQDIAPYKSKEMRTFAEDKSGDEAVKAEMKEALAHVKAQNYKLALQAYLGIYARYKNPAAAENASIIYEALGDTEAALNIMLKVYEETGNPTAQLVIARLSKILDDKIKIAASEQEGIQNPVDRVVAYASDEIQHVLPSGAAVWFHNNSPGNNMAEAVIDNLTADFIRKGIGIADNASGAKILVIIGVAGEGAMRRLQVNVLDIEKGIPIMQSDTSEKWQM